MPGQCFQPQIVEAQVESAGQFDGAHHGIDGQGRHGQLGFGCEEGIVEPGVVRHQGPAVHQFGDILGDVAESRLILEHLGGDAVHMGGAGIDARVHQADHRLLDIAHRIEGQRGNADDPGLTRAKTGRLDVDDDPAVG